MQTENREAVVVGYASGVVPRGSNRGYSCSGFCGIADLIEIRLLIDCKPLRLRAQENGPEFVDRVFSVIIEFLVTSA